MIKDLIKCHNSFILNKPIKIISLIIFIGLFVIYLLLLNSFPNDLSYIELIYNFYQVSYDIMKIFIIIVSIIISGFSFFSQNDQYRYLVISKEISRSKYIITKILVIILFLMLFSFIESIIIATIGYIKFHIINRLIIDCFLDLNIGIIYYTGLSILIIQIFDYFYSIFISISIFITSSIIENSIITYIIPIYRNNTLSVSNFYRYYCLFLCVVLFVINVIVYNIKDLN